LLGQGVEKFWAAVSEYQTLQTANGNFQSRRQNQSLAWMWERIDAGLKQSFKNNPAVREQLPQLTKAVQSGQMAASTAARNLLAALAGRA
jgi:LAO/AO transport system kinase